MDVKLNEPWKGFVDREIARGRYDSADAVVIEGLRLVAEREDKLQVLRDAIQKAIADDVEVSDEEIDAALEARAAELRRQGYAD